MKRFFKRLALGILLALPWIGAASAQQVNNYWWDGTPGTSCPSCWVPTSPTNPMPVVGPTSGALGNVGGFNISVSSTPTVQNASYSSGNAIGGLQTIAFFRTTAQPSGILNNVLISSQGGSTTAITLYIFNANPSASTCTDKSAFALNSADVSKLIATTPPILTPAVVGVGTTVTMASQQLPISVKNTDGTATVNLYVCAVVGGTVTPASTSDLVFKFAGVQD